VDVVINNVGFADYKKSAKSVLVGQNQMIQLNITTPTELTHRILPGMIKPKPGHAVNMAGNAAFLLGY